METSGSSYNAPRLHVAIEARKIVISGEVAGLQIQLGTPAFPGRFDSCDLPPKCLTLFRNLFYLADKKRKRFLSSLSHYFNVAMNANAHTHVQNDLNENGRKRKHEQSLNDSSKSPKYVREGSLDKMVLKEYNFLALELCSGMETSRIASSLRCSTTFSD